MHHVGSLYILTYDARKLKHKIIILDYKHIYIYIYIYSPIFNQISPINRQIYSVIQEDDLNFVSLYFKIRTSDKYDVNYITLRRLNTCQTVGCGIPSSLLSLYGLTCVGYAQNSLEFVSCSPLIHVVGRSVCRYTEIVFAQIGDSNDKCPSSLEVES